MEWIFWFFLIILAVIILFGVVGLRIVREQERWVVEFLGEYYRIIRPGLRWIFPGLMRVRAVVSIWEQPIELFLEKPWIDFKEGGTAQLVEPTAWVRVKGAEEENEEMIEENIFRMIYGVTNWRIAVREAGETGFRSCLNNLTVEETLKKLLQLETKKGYWWQVVKESFPDLEAEIENWGLVIKRITVSDFNWSEEVKEIRDRVFQRQRAILEAKFSAEAAKHESLKKALEAGGMHGAIKRILVREYDYHSKEAEKIANQYVTYFKGTETGRIIDWRGEGGDLASMITRIIVATQVAKETMEKKGDKE